METKDFVRMLKNKNNLDEKLNVINQVCKKEIIVDDIEVRDWRSALRNKEREYEELRQYHEKFKNFVASLIFDTDCINRFERFVVAFEDWKAEICKDRDKYKQALDEVERFIKEDVCDEECGFNWKKSCSDCDCRYNNIIDIISKAKDRKNA